MSKMKCRKRAPKTLMVALMNVNIMDKKCECAEEVYDFYGELSLQLRVDFLERKT